MLIKNSTPSYAGGKYLYAGAVLFVLLLGVMLGVVYENRIVPLIEKVGLSSLVMEKVEGLYAQYDHIKHRGVKNKELPKIEQKNRLEIFIKHNDYESLKLQIKLSRESNKMAQFTQPYLQAEFKYNGLLVKGKVRLKGTTTDHVNTDKPSFRVVLKKGKTIKGMRQFTLQHPWMRNYLYEMVFHEALRREGLPALRYGFIHVSINGEAVGIYAMEEHFEKRLLENNKRMEGVIVKPQATQLQVGGVLILNGLDAAKSKKVQSSKALSEQFTNANKLMLGFYRGNYLAKEVFDIHQLAKYVAIVDLLGCWHAAHWSSGRFYYNPITTRFEIIGYDAMCQGVTPGILVGIGRSYHRAKGDNDLLLPLFKRIFDDRDFYRLYIKELFRVSEASYVKNLLAEIKPSITDAEMMLQEEWPKYGFYEKHYFSSASKSIDLLYAQQKVIRGILDIRHFSGDYLGVYDGIAMIDVANTGMLPLEAVGLFSGDHSPLLEFNQIIETRECEKCALKFQELKVSVGNTFNAKNRKILLGYRLLGAEDIKYIELADKSALFALIRKGDVFRGSSGMDVLKVSDKIKIKDDKKRVEIIGDVTFRQSFSLPEGYALVVSEGVTIDLVDAASIILNGPIYIFGSPENQVNIISSDGTGGGVIVIQAKRQSVIKHANFRGLSNPSQLGWQPPGSVTFYESPVDIFKTTFIANKSEDMLHIMRTRFVIDGVRFSNALSDSFDGDYVTGKLYNTTFDGCGDDAIDFSGSKVEISNVQIRNARDKGLSLGEDSMVAISNVTIVNANIGIAVKDSSELNGRQIRIKGSKVAITAYEKKSEYGPARAYLKNVRIQESERNYLAEAGSVINVDGVDTPTEEVSLKDIFY